jgi:hypothetical protein
MGEVHANAVGWRTTADSPHYWFHQNQFECLVICVIGITRFDFVQSFFLWLTSKVSILLYGLSAEHGCNFMMSAYALQDQFNSMANSFAA